MITYDEKSGWVESSGEPRWRATKAAVDRATGVDIYWTNGNRARPVYVAHLANGTAIAVLRKAHARWTVNMEGFEFWHHVKVMNRDMWTGPIGFDTLLDAKRFVVDMLEQLGSTIHKTRSK